jgi:thiosulfate/3-mercaptopyruvate sulfurtransferase
MMKKNRFILGSIVLLIAGAAIFIFNMSNKPGQVQESVTITPEVYKHGEDIFITPAELKSKLGNKGVIILDGNLPKVYAKGHIAGAINIGFTGLSRSTGKPGDPLWGTILPKEELTQKLESFGVTNDSLIVAYSDTFKGPGAGGRAVWQLRMAGLTNVKLLYGGLEVWRRLGYELTQDDPQLLPSSGLILSNYDEKYRANLQFVKENLGKIPLLDVRSKDEFTGDNTSRGESRGGHIAGAHWLEWTELLNEDSTPKPPEEIIKLMASYGVGPDDDIVLY